MTVQRRSKSLLAIAARLFGELACLVVDARRQRRHHTCLVTFAAYPPACIHCGRTMP